MAGLVGISRIKAPVRHHDFWDIFGGAVLGVGTTYLFTKPFEKPKIEMSFAANSDYKLVTIKYIF